MQARRRSQKNKSPAHCWMRGAGIFVSELISSGPPLLTYAEATRREAGRFELFAFRSAGLPEDLDVAFAETFEATSSGTSSSVPPVMR